MNRNEINLKWWTTEIHNLLLITFWVIKVCIVPQGLFHEICGLLTEFQSIDCLLFLLAN